MSAIQATASDWQRGPSVSAYFQFQPVPRQSLVWPCEVITHGWPRFTFQWQLFWMLNLNAGQGSLTTVTDCRPYPKHFSVHSIQIFISYEKPVFYPHQNWCHAPVIFYCSGFLMWRNSWDEFGGSGAVAAGVPGPGGQGSAALSGPDRPRSHRRGYNFCHTGRRLHRRWSHLLLNLETAERWGLFSIKGPTRPRVLSGCLISPLYYVVHLTGRLLLL